jgi:hypothetical protein
MKHAMKHATTHATTHTPVSRSGLPPLPADVARRVLADLRSAKPERKRQAIEALLAARAFAAGFVQGADVERARRRHVVDPHHAHWLRGYDAGQRAAAGAAAHYLGDQLRTPRAALDAPAPTPSAPRSNAGPRTPRPSTRAISAPFSPQLTLI